MQSIQETTAAEAAILLDIKRRTVYAAIARGRLRVRRWERAIILDRRDVERYRTARRVGRPPKSKTRK